MMITERDNLWDAYYYFRHASDCAYREYVLIGANAGTGFYRGQSEEMLAKAADVLGYDLIKREAQPAETSEAA